MRITSLAIFVGSLSLVATVALPRAAAAQTVETREVTTLTSRSGTVTEIAPSSSTIIVKSESSPQPMRYTFTPKTAFVDPTGRIVSRHVIDGQPVTIYFDREGDQLVASKVVLAHPENVVEREVEPGIRVESGRGVPYVTGGTGKDERETLPALAKDHDLKLVFAEEVGQPRRPLVSDVSVRISDRAGRELLDVDNAGPLLFAKVPSGTYQVAATARGRTLTQVAKVVEGRQTQLAFYW